MGARELLADLAGAGFTVEADRDRLLIRPASRLTDELRAALRAAKPDLLTLLSVGAARPYRLSQADADAAHAEPWDDAAIGRFVVRLSLFLRRGIDATDADDLAERLHLRDLQSDDRRLCLECAHLAGRTHGSWRCGNAREAGVGIDLPSALVTLPQRCSGFKA
jgi:TubC N-terminal docking domain